MSTAPEPAHALQAYVVGGAVRDGLLGRPVNDRDWVVVGATPERMRAAGFRQVGADFPVFLHPQTNEEYALARTERKSAPGYRGFTVQADPSVTLEQDLSRRDLTINAMALAQRRPLDRPAWRRARPAAARAAPCVRCLCRGPGAHPARGALCRALCRLQGRARDPGADARAWSKPARCDALVAERVWQELARGLMEATPSRMFELLRDCGALRVLLPEVDRLWGVPQPPEHHPEIDTGVHLMQVLDEAARVQASLPVRFACLCHDLGKGSTPADQWPRHIGHEQRGARLARALGQRLKAPLDCRELAELTAREHGHVHASLGLQAAALLRLLERCDAPRRPERFAELLLACQCDARGRLGFAQRDYPQRLRLLQALALARAVDSSAVAQHAAALGQAGPQIGQALHAARVEALRQGLHTA